MADVIYASKMQYSDNNLVSDFLKSYMKKFKNDDNICRDNFANK